MKPDFKGKKEVDVLGFPMDLGASRRGVGMGPAALRIAGIVEKLELLGYQVRDQGDVAIQSREHQEIGDIELKYLHEIVRTTGILATQVENSLSSDRFPLCIGGDHSMAIGTIAGIASHCNNRQLEPGVIWIDAHADMNTEKTTPSGNIHGMAMAACLGLGHPKLTRLKGFGPKVKPENCVLIGIRKLDPLEKKTVRNLRLPVFTMTDIDKKGLYEIMRNVLKKFKKTVDHLHVSFDLDSVDPPLTPGVGTPVPGGLSFRETHLLMEMIAEQGNMSSLEIAEVNPILDIRNQSAVFASDIIASSMGKRIL